MKNQLTQRDIRHIKSVGWGIVIRTNNGWENREDPAEKIDGRVLDKLERMNLIEGVQSGTTTRSAKVVAVLTEQGKRALEQYQK